VPAAAVNVFWVRATFATGLRLTSQNMQPNMKTNADHSRTMNG
jgi:hypothetical protein